MYSISSLSLKEKNLSICSLRKRWYLYFCNDVLKHFSKEKVCFLVMLVWRISAFSVSTGEKKRISYLLITDWIIYRIALKVFAICWNTIILRFSLHLKAAPKSMAFDDVLSDVSCSILYYKTCLNLKLTPKRLNSSSHKL